MPLSPYVSFPGNCADAIAFYQKALGAELLYKITFGEMPKNDQNSDEGCASNMQFSDTDIAHANLRIAESSIMMSDGIQRENLQYSGFTLALDPPNVNVGKAWFDALAEGGKIGMAWQETFWAEGFGTVTDKFGVPWLVNAVKAQ